MAQVATTKVKWVMKRLMKNVLLLQTKPNCAKVAYHIKCLRQLSQVPLLVLHKNNETSGHY